MSAPAPDSEALATRLRAARRSVLLTGLRLGGPEHLDLTHAGGEWAARANLEAFLTEPARFWEYFYPTAQRISERQPGPAHDAIARLQEAGVIWGLVTQAVDRLHQRAGSADVIEVYGSVLTERCERCGERYALPEVGALIGESPDGIPRCTTDRCGYPLRPEGTLWGEPLPRPAIERAWQLAAEADLFVVLDSDLRTAPISFLPSVPLTRGVPLVVVGETPTQYDRYAELLIRGPSAPVLEATANLVLGPPPSREA